jgi:hypothetical protein
MTKCTSEILLDIGVILAHSDQLDTDHLNSSIDKWVGNVSTWKSAGLFSGLHNYMGDFVQKNSIVIDETVFLFPSPVSELTLPSSLARKIPCASKKLNSFDKSRISF